MGGIYGYSLYFNVNPPQSEVINKIQFLFLEPLIIAQHEDYVEITNPADNKDQVDVQWINERNMILPPELVGRVKIPFPELPQAIRLEAAPVKIGWFTYGPGRLLTAITQVLEELGGKSEPTNSLAD